LVKSSHIKLFLLGAHARCRRAASRRTLPYIIVPHVEAGLRPPVCASCLALMCMTLVDPWRCHMPRPHTLAGRAASRHWPSARAHTAAAWRHVVPILWPSAMSCPYHGHAVTRLANRLSISLAPIKGRRPPLLARAPSTSTSAIAAADELPAPLAYGVEPWHVDPLHTKPHQISSSCGRATIAPPPPLTGDISGRATATNRRGAR
jgi:hypothetical protein